MRLVFAAVLVSIPVALACAACGSSEAGGGGTGGVSDGKVHPAGNGQHESQDAACQALSHAQDTRSLALQCVTTTKPCPSLVLTMVGGTECLEYDQGSVQGCIDYYGMAATCDDLAKAFDDCVVTAFPDSAPKGCP